jgi:hypothetical protein
MQVVSNRKEKIYRNDYEGKPIYKIGLSKKNQDGNYTNGYMLCSFKKGTDIPNKTYINIKNAWLDFYLKEKETIPYIFINEYEIIKDEEVVVVENITTEELDDMPLPF